ncbi:MAG: 3'-5' exonuclease [Gammaproteobacteria bacterium]|jgi:predicted PolB exonuclease-like 3'-5' exonuclease|nr:3'-5' exonuclease [Gammaproteobacteria bacterium]
MNVFVFDIETVPDVDAGRRLYDLDGLQDAEIAEIMFHKQREASGNDFLRHHLHRVVAISVVLRSADRFKLWSLGDATSPEHELIQRFFDGLDRYSPTLVSWNGSGFDLPVLHYRSLLHGIVASRYWETGADDSSFRWNNYLSRFHERHTDLMDVLSGHQPRASVSLQDMALLLGLPGKLGMHGALVWEHYLAGDVEGIRNYCETDVLNTFLVYLRFELIRGRLTEEAYQGECDRLRATLEEDGRPHVTDFLHAWADGRTS